MFGNAYYKRRVLLTGHTGFKGSWLSLWLHTLGAEVTGVSLPPEQNPNHWDILKLDIKEHRTDIRDFKKISDIINQSNPEIVFHLAAQSLVRRSYKSPRETWETNLMGSCNVLEACRDASGLKGIIFVTTDKCYDTKNSTKAFNESDRLGGQDPYSASKASCELLAASYRDSFFKSAPLIATARAGNVIGGGDWAEDRIIPDLVRAQQKNIDLSVRSPNAIRPWQHVLEPLCGYLQLGQKFLEGRQEFQGAWNFGPDDTGVLSVADLLGKIGARWKALPDNGPYETKFLMLDSTKARNELFWQQIMPIDQQISITSEWYKSFYQSNKILSYKHLALYIDLARQKNAVWV